MIPSFLFGVVHPPRIVLRRAPRALVSGNPAIAYVGLGGGAILVRRA